MRKIYHLILCTVVMSACSSSGNREANDRSGEKPFAISSCLADKDYKYEALLTKADIEKHVDIDEATFKKEISRTKGKYGSCTYRWESSRPRIEKVIAGRTMKLSDPNQVTIKLLDFYTDEDLERNKQESIVDLFDMGYKKLSREEYDSIMANLEKKMGNKPEDLARAQKMMKSRMNFNYKLIDNLGDRAYWKWTDYGIELAVLVGSAKFTIVSKTSGMAETSLEHAVQLAREVLAKCGS